jgi:hypothetical protein
MYVDCVLASSRIAQANPGRRTPHYEVVLSQLFIRAGLRQHNKYLKTITMLC